MGISITGGVKVPQGLVTITNAPVEGGGGPSGGPVWAWGAGGNGRLGEGDTISRSSPIQIGALETWANTGAGQSHTHAIKNDGTLWAWGRGLNGALGLVDLNDRSSPVQVGALTNWASVEVGQDIAAAIKTDGSLWTWGRGLGGELGHGDVVVRSSPVQIGSLTDWASVSLIRANIAAIKTDGSLWAWGSNVARGKLGVGDTIDRSSPVQVGFLTDWAIISAGRYHTHAIKTDGTLWAWGFASSGRLGDGTTVNKSSPIQIGALTDWSNVFAGNEHALAIKTDGTLWAWGYNFNVTGGALGDGTVITRSSPVQIGLLTTWASASASGSSHAIKTDGTLWSWGQNYTGALGHGDTVNRSSPVQVGALTVWDSVYMGANHTIAIKTTT